MKRMNSKVAAAVLLFATTGCGVIAPRMTNALPRPSLMGTWLLNTEQSSDSAQAALPAEDRPPFEDIAVGQRRGWLDVDSMRSVRVAGERAARAVEVVRAPVEKLSISDSAGAIVLRADEHNAIAFVADGSTRHASWLDGRMVSYEARWVEQRLEVVRRIDGGLTIREYYSRSPGSTQLVVFTIVSGPFHGEVTLRRVYDAATS